MANTIQFKRGLEADRTSVTPAAGEILYTTDDKKVYIGDGSTAGGNIVSAAGGAAIEAIASGALANGDLVVVNSDGTVSVVAEASTSVSQSKGTAYNYTSSNFRSAIAYDTINDRLLAVGVDLKAYIGTISGQTLSFDSGTTFTSTSSSNRFQISFDPDAGCFIIFFLDGSGYLRALTATISGTSVTFGTEVAIVSAYIGYMSYPQYSPTQQCTVIGLEENSNSTYVVGLSVSGTSITAGSQVNVHSAASALGVGLTYDSANDKFLFVGRDGNYYGQGYASVVSATGTSLSAGSLVYFTPSFSATASPQPVYDPSTGNIAVIDYNAGIRVTLGSISGTSSTWGSSASVSGASTGTSVERSVVYHAASGKIVLTYQDSAASSKLSMISGTVGSTSVTWDTRLVVSADAMDSPLICYASQAPAQVVATYRSTVDYLGYAQAFTPAYTYLATNLTASNYIGISDGAYADTATATIQTAGAVDDAQTGLTAGSTYYVQRDGTLSTTADSPSVVAGTAVSSTSILVKG